MYSDQLEQDQFWKNFGLSIGVHAAIIVFAVLIGKLSFSIFGADKTEIIHSSVRVDVVGMPKYTIQELKEIQKQIANDPVPEAPAKGKEEVVVKKEEAADVIKEGDLVIKEKDKDAKKKSLSNLLANYSDKKVQAKEVKKGSKEGTGKNLEALIIEGNRLSKGSALVGDYSDTESSAYVSYVQAIPGLVRPFWKLPSYLLGKELRARVRVYINQSGHIIKTEVYETSGQPEFDTRAEQALREAAPFPAPAPDVAPQLARAGVILGFPL